MPRPASDTSTMSEPPDDADDWTDLLKWALGVGISRHGGATEPADDVRPRVVCGRIRLVHPYRNATQTWNVGAVGLPECRLRPT